MKELCVYLVSEGDHQVQHFKSVKSNWWPQTQQRTCVTCFDCSFAELLVWFGRRKKQQLTAFLSCSVVI